MRLLRCHRLVRAAIFGLAPVLLLGCSSKLTRGKAEQLIKAQFHLPSTQTRSFLLFEGNLCRDIGRYRPCRTSDIPKEWQALQNEGLVTIALTDFPPAYRQWGPGKYQAYRVSLTEKGRQYALGGTFEPPESQGRTPYKSEAIVVRTSTLEFGEITGIEETEQFGFATVHYTLSQTAVTPFGKLAFELEPSTPHQLTFKKYDDGWRIEQ